MSPNFRNANKRINCHSSWAEQTSLLSRVTSTRAMTLTSKQDANQKNNDLKDNIQQSIADQVDQLGSCCSLFLDEALASVKVPRTVLPTPCNTFRTGRATVIQLFYKEVKHSLYSYFFEIVLSELNLFNLTEFVFMHFCVCKGFKSLILLCCYCCDTLYLLCWHV